MAGITDRSINALVARALLDGKRMTLTDGSVPGLAMLVIPGGARSWKLRYYVQGKQKEITIGKYPAWGIAKARRKARALRLAVEDGLDVAIEKQARKAEGQAKALAIAVDRAMLGQVVDWLSTWWAVASNERRAELFKDWQQAVSNIPGASKWPG